MDNCFYCGALVMTNGVGDHFPIPQRHGGIDTVPCCTSCHDMKDRSSLDSWPIDWIEVIMDDMKNMKRETKIFLAKSIYLCLDATKTLKERK